MGKKSTLLFLAVLLLFFSACGKEEPKTVTLETIVPTVALEMESMGEEELANQSIVILDNEYVKIVSNGKYSENDPHKGQVMGYRVCIENKTDYYLSLWLSNYSIDGFMLNSKINPPMFTTSNIGPRKKANTEICIDPKYEQAVTLSSLDDLKNFDASISISTNTDGGNIYQNVGAFPFENVLP